MSAVASTAGCSSARMEGSPPSAAEVAPLVLRQCWGGAVVSVSVPVMFHGGNHCGQHCPCSCYVDTAHGRAVSAVSRRRWQSWVGLLGDTGGVVGPKSPRNIRSLQGSGFFYSVACQNCCRQWRPHHEPRPACRRNHPAGAGEHSAWRGGVAVCFFVCFPSLIYLQLCHASFEIQTTQSTRFRISRSCRHKTHVKQIIFCHGNTAPCFTILQLYFSPFIGTVVSTVKAFTTHQHASTVVGRRSSLVIFYPCFRAILSTEFPRPKTLLRSCILGRPTAPRGARQCVAHHRDKSAMHIHGIMRRVTMGMQTCATVAMTRLSTLSKIQGIFPPSSRRWLTCNIRCPTQPQPQRYLPLCSPMWLAT
eukprot:m.763870 g.763870  ORF g.763870 m.763870 type:complete len:362 (+) comp23211_c0_seq74:1180-2265(+)